MFDRVIEYLENLASGYTGKPGTAENEKILAIAALLYRMVTIDGVVREIERVKLRDILRDTFAIDAGHLEGLIKKAKIEHADTAGLFPFTAIIMRRCTLEEREDIAKAMWRIALCDDEFHEFEGSLLERACELMEVSCERPEI